VPRLSVLMPAYEASATVRAAVRSTLAALPRDAELVVLDDGSIDDTAARAEQGAGGDPRVRVIRAPRNLGVAGAGRHLLAVTDSELIARMDADDVTLPTRFRASIRRLDRGADVVFTAYQVIDHRGRPIRRPSSPIPISPRAGALALLIDCPYAQSTLLARRAVLEEAGGYRDAESEDYDLWLRVALRGGRFARLSRPGVLLRAHAASFTARPGFRSRVARDPLVAEGYLGLARELLGVEATPWLPHLSFLRDGPLAAVGRAPVAEFVTRFGAALDAADLGALERWMLRRRARQELTTRA
jgi:glycosyltransferase involved in cell wall biosynthesis